MGFLDLTDKEIGRLQSSVRLPAPTTITAKMLNYTVKSILWPIAVLDNPRSVSSTMLSVFGQVARAGHKSLSARLACRALARVTHNIRRL